MLTIVVLVNLTATFFVPVELSKALVKTYPKPLRYSYEDSFFSLLLALAVGDFLLTKSTNVFSLT
jgi:hypothetical protein